MPLRVVIADDEATARRRLRRLLGAIDGVELVAEVEGGRALLERLERDDVDVVLLDVQMPDLSGLDVTAQLPDGRPYVVFTTAHAEHAVSAFDVGAADYVLKPIELDRLRTALERARRALEPSQHRELSRSRLAVPTARGVVLVDVDAIRCVVWDGQLCVVHADEELLSDRSLAELAACLPDRFVRAHRRVLLNLDHVARLEPLDTGGYRAHIDEDLSVPVGRRAARQLRKQLGLR